MNTTLSEKIANRILYQCEAFKVDYRLIGAESTMYPEGNREAF